MNNRELLARAITTGHVEGLIGVANEGTVEAAASAKGLDADLLATAIEDGGSEDAVRAVVEARHSG